MLELSALWKQWDGCQLAVVVKGEGGWPTSGWPVAVFLGASLSEMAGAEDLVGGSENALG